MHTSQRTTEVITTIHRPRQDHPPLGWVGKARRNCSAAKISRSQFERRPSAADRLRPARSHHIGRQWTALGHEVRRIQEQLRVDARSSMINGQPTRSFGYGRNFGKLAGSRRRARPGQRGSIAAHRATNSKNEEQMRCEGRDRHVALKGRRSVSRRKRVRTSPRALPPNPSPHRVNSQRQ
jgi:hypothetical protein